MKPVVRLFFLVLLCLSAWQVLAQGSRPAELAAELPAEVSGRAGEQPAGEIYKDPMEGVFRLSGEEAPTWVTFRSGTCWLLAYWLGVCGGWWWRRKEMFPGLLLAGAGVAALNLASGFHQSVAGVVNVGYGIVFGRITAAIGGRTGLGLLVWVGFFAGGMPGIKGADADSFSSLPELSLFPSLVHAFLAVFMGWPILVVGGLRRFVSGGFKGLLQRSFPAVENTAVAPVGKGKGCFAGFGFLLCFLAGINVLGHVVGATPARRMLEAPEVSFEEFRTNPRAWKYAKIKQCPLALAEASFELTRKDDSDSDRRAKDPILSSLLVPMARTVEGKLASTSLLLKTDRTRWRQLFLRGFAPRFERFRFPPREIVRYGKFIDQHRQDFYPVVDLTVEVAETPSMSWSADPIAVPLDSGNELFERPRPGGLVEPFTRVTDLDRLLREAVLWWGLSISFLCGYLIWIKEP